MSRLARHATTAIATAAVAFGAARLAAQPEKPALKKITEHRWVHAGPINVGIVRDGEKALLIDCGDGSVAGQLSQLGVKTVEQIIFTHHHRDQVCGAYSLAAGGTQIGAPGGVPRYKEFPAERTLFERPMGYFDRRWVNWCYHPDYLIPAEPLKVDASYADGQAFRWGPAEIKALATPGHTDGSVSYVVNVDDKCVVFSGDCIYDEGQVWELYGLTRAGMPYNDGPGLCWSGNTTFEYEGFMWGRCELEKSLARIKEVKPAMLVPSHGRLMSDPAKAIDALVARLEQCWEKYWAINCLRGSLVGHFRVDIGPLHARSSR